jgi:hypothetical protein
VAIAVAWQTVVTVGTAITSNQLWTTPTATGTTFAYARDLVCTNSGAPTILVSLTASAGTNIASTLSSFQIPSGGSLILTQCQIPASATVSAVTLSTAATGQLSIGYATNVAYM